MVAFIKQHGDEEVSRIRESTQQEFTIEHNKFIEEEKKRYEEDIKAKLQNEEVRLKIEQSKKQNEMRIERMRKVNEYVEELRQQTKAQVREKMKKDKKAYAQLIEDLLVQGLIKMMEGTLYIRCRKDDEKIIEQVQGNATKRYRELIVKEVKRFQDMKPDEIPCTLIIDKTYLDSVEDNETTGIIGGFKMYAKKGRIVCS
jgi:V-type H+-transporting ATPase subunit E